jgi:hypothetical protein
MRLQLIKKNRFLAFVVMAISSIGWPQLAVPDDGACNHCETVVVDTKNPCKGTASGCPPCEGAVDSNPFPGLISAISAYSGVDIHNCSGATTTKWCGGFNINCVRVSDCPWPSTSMNNYVCDGTQSCKFTTSSSIKCRNLQSGGSSAWTKKFDSTCSSSNPH